MDSFRAMDGVTREEIKSATEIFESSMRWCIDGRDLVSIGLRAVIVISVMRPTLQFGLRIDQKAARSFKKLNAGVNGAMELTGSLFSRVLEWLRRSDNPAECGERIIVLFYVLRPDLICVSTLATMGNISNKTRQAKDKLANCLRDTYSNIKTRVMRGNITRDRCRNVKRSQPINYADNY
jgi:hypothetical protein